MSDKRGKKMIAMLLFSVLVGVGSRAGSGSPMPVAGEVQMSATAIGSAEKTNLLDITLERRRNGKIEQMATGHVFDAGDVIRIRLNSHFVGYLYVMNQGTTGKFTTVFPAVDTGNDNRVTPDKVYLVPATEDGWFEVQGPAGFDTLYFLLSPTALATPTVANFVSPAPASSLKPRCDDKVFRAIGECTDPSAGPAAVAPTAVLPAPLVPLAGTASRDIVFSKKKGEATVEVAGSSTAPMLYTFRLAHR